MKKKHIHDLPEDSLGMIDDQGHRFFIHPAAVKGFFRRWRTRVYWVLIFILLALPWIRIGGHQAILLNIPERRFAFFGVTFWAHDGPIIFFLLITAAIGLAFVTSIWGRVWCGWGCPQTVFIDGLYRQIETWVEGNHMERRALDQAPWSGKKISKRSLKWTLYALVSLVITHSVLAYFVGSQELAVMMTESPWNHPISFMFAWITGAIILLDFGWFREQFCIIACPYGRFQSVLMDNHSLAPLYDEKRGEPRKAKEVSPAEQGDCVSCYKCVSVCPTGIDIRRGVQLECIACTACIDACDEVMEKLNKPKGLIRYGTEIEMAGGERKVFRPRVFLYLALIFTAVSSLSITLSKRESLDIRVLRATEAPYKIMPAVADSPKTISNHFRLHLHNLDIGKSEVLIILSPIAKRQGVEMVAPINPAILAPGKTGRPHVFFKFPESFTAEEKKKKIEVLFYYIVGDTIEIFKRPITLVGP